MKKKITLVLSRLIEYSYNFRYLHSSVLVLFAILPLGILVGQTIVYSNNFNVSENPLGASNGGTPNAVTWTNVTTSTGYVRTNIFPVGGTNNALQINNNTTVGRTYTWGDLSNFDSPFQKILSSNSSDITWTFNMRTSYNYSSTGFDATANSFGSAVVLCASSSDLLTANGYAVTLTKGVAYSAVRLVKFTGGLSSNANISLIIGPSAESTVHTDYFSVKVVYSPATNTWKLYSRIDGSGTMGDPATGVLTQVGTGTVDYTYTTNSMSYFGFLFNHQKATSFSACFDNFKVVRSAVIDWTSGWPKAENPSSNGFTAKVNTSIAGTTYYVVVAKDASAPSSAQVKAGQDAAGVAATASGSITCVAGNTEYTAAAGGSLAGSTSYDVYYALQDASGNLQSNPVKVSVTTSAGYSAPSIQDPTATSITNNSALLGGNITSDGGSTISERGTVWSTTTGVTIDDNKLDETGRTTGTFSHSRTSLPAKSKIYYKAYATNSVNTTLSTEGNFYTLADEPTEQVGGFTATAAGNTSVDLSWAPATGADGYIILLRQGAAAPTTDPADASYYTIGSTLGNGTVAAYITSGATTAKTISGLNGGTTYTFKILSVNSDGVNAGTYNYFTVSAPTASASTPTVTYTWNQTETASWTTASNWTPTRTSPDLSDILQFNSGGSIVVTDVPTQTIAQLSVTNNTTLELKSTAASTLTIGGASGTDFGLDAGSALNINQSNAIVIALATGTTGSISGNMSVSGGGHLLTAVDAGAISFKTGATFTGGTGLTTNPFGKTSLNSVVFEGGSSFIFIGGFNPFGANAPSSVVVFQTGSMYIHKAPGVSSPSLGQRTYANFELNESNANISAATTQPVTIDHLTVTAGLFGLGVSNTLTIKGNLSVAAGATLNLNPVTAGTINLKGDLDIASGGTLNINPTVTEALTFSGTGIQSVNNAGTFSSNSGTSYIVSNPVGVNVASNLTIPGLTINSGAIMNINAGKQMTVSSAMSNNGRLNLLSSEEGTATIITPSTIITGVNAVTTVQQYFTSSRNWYISSPVSEATSLPVVDAGTLTFYSYTESDANQQTGANGYAAGAVWNTVNDGVLATGKGYIVKPGAATSTITFSGSALNSGDQQINGLTRTTINPKQGFNLIGNPYPSYLNVLPSIVANSNLEPTVWYRTRDNANYYHYETVNATTGVGTNASLTGRVTGYIPPMQGFWIKTNSDNQSITLSNANRSHSTSTDLSGFGLGSVPTTSLKAPEVENHSQTLLGLKISNGITGDETILMFTPQASNSLDKFDSGKLSNSNINIPELFTVSQGCELAINGMNAIPFDTEMPIGFTTGKSGSFTINASQLSNFAESTQILLKDNINVLNPVITDLMTNAYNFESDITTGNTSRFSLIFKSPSVTTNLKSDYNANVSIWSNNQNKITIIAPEESDYTIYNTCGQKITDGLITSNKTIVNTDCKAGIYLVKVNCKGKISTSKVVVK